jgi:putative PIN family toxin of toxin-antitoxin system
VKVVFDTNVLFAAFVASGLCSELYESARDLGAIRVSAFILGELEEKLAVKAGLKASEIEAVLSMVRRDSETVGVGPLDRPVCRDCDDDWILATGLAAQADCIATGDKELLDLESFRDIPIVTPRQCLEWRLKQG